VTGVTRTTFGIYCVQLDSSVDAAATRPVLTVDSFHSASLSNGVMALIDGRCGENLNGFAVRTVELTSGTFLTSNSVAFVIAVP
jgi:hypothetical protein